VSGGRPAVLGDVNGRTASELSHVIAPSAIRELMSVLKVMAEDGPPAPMGILDVVDSLHNGLPDPEARSGIAGRRLTREHAAQALETAQLPGAEAKNRNGWLTDQVECRLPSSRRTEGAAR
jgi:hypothetical protein